MCITYENVHAVQAFHGSLLVSYISPVALVPN